MVDTLPTFDEDYGATGAGDNSMPGAEESGEGGNGDSGSESRHNERHIGRIWQCVIGNRNRDTRRRRHGLE
jgi:hypothetical protein